MRRGWLKHAVAIAAFAIVTAWVTVGAVRAQDAGNGAAAKPQMMTKDADPDWEIVAVKPDDPNSTETGFWVRDRQLEIKGKTAEQLLLYGYGLNEDGTVARRGRCRRSGATGPGTDGEPGAEAAGGAVRAGDAP